MQASYKKTQTGWLIVFIFVPIIVFFALILFYQEVLGRSLGTNPAPSWIMLVSVLLFLILLSLFATLTVTGFGDHLEVKFGIGLIRKRFFYRNIRSCLVKRNPFIYGWGIRKIPGGWLYNVSGY
jgi:hypothetical protein